MNLPDVPHHLTLHLLIHSLDLFHPISHEHLFILPLRHNLYLLMRLLVFALFIVKRWSPAKDEPAGGLSKPYHVPRGQLYVLVFGYELLIQERPMSASKVI